MPLAPAITQNLQQLSSGVAVGDIGPDGRHTGTKDVAGGTGLGAGGVDGRTVDDVCEPAAEGFARPDVTANVVNLTAADPERLDESPYLNDPQYANANTAAGPSGLFIPPPTPTEMDALFETPAVVPAGPQSIAIRARTSFVDATGPTGDFIVASLVPPTMLVEVFDGATLIAAETFVVPPSYPNGLVFRVDFDSADLVNPTGADVFVHVEGHPVIQTLDDVPGLGDGIVAGWTVEFGAFRWYVNVDGCCTTDTDEHAPATLTNLVNATGTVDEIQEPPDNDDGQWIDAGILLGVPVGVSQMDVTFADPGLVTTEAFVRFRARTSFVDPLDPLLPALALPQVVVSYSEDGGPLVGERAYTVASNWPNGDVFDLPLETLGGVAYDGGPLRVHFRMDPVIVATTGWIVELGSARLFIVEGCEPGGIARFGSGTGEAGAPVELVGAAERSAAATGEQGTDPTVDGVAARANSHTGEQGTDGVAAVGTATHTGAAAGAAGADALTFGGAVVVGGAARFDAGADATNFRRPPLPGGGRLCDPGDPHEASDRFCDVDDGTGRACSPAEGASRLCSV